MSPRTLRAAATCLLAVATACRSPKDDPVSPSPTLTVTPATAEIAPNSGPFAFTATQTVSTAAVSWSVVAGTCASPGTVGATTGVYTPPVTNDVACTLKVRATAGALTADATVNLSARSASGATLAVTPTSGSVRAGSATPFTIYVDSSDSITTPSCALSPNMGTCVEAVDPGTHTHAFEVTAPSGLVKTVTAVEVTITVGTLSGLVAVTVEPSVLVVSGPSTVRAGGATATYTVSAPDVTGETVVWSVEPAIGSISAAGVYTPPATQQATTFDVVATIGGARGALSVSLQPPATAGTASAGFLEMVSAVNAKIVECLAWPGFPAGEMNAVAASIQSSVDAGRLTYDAAAQATCLASIDATTCLQILHGVDFTECVESAFTGRVAQGAQCGDSLECSAGYCSFPTGTCPGECVPRVASNGACGADDQCAAGLVCSNSTCSAVTVVADGATCNDVTEVCGATSYCKPPGTSSRSCAPLGIEGNACRAATECSASLTCDLVTYTCRAYAARNQPCGTTAACNYFTDYCTPGGTCGALPVLGESCAYSRWCHGDSWCDTSLAVPTCVARPTLGQPCTGTGGCDGQAYCDYMLTTPACVATKTSGSCTFPNECATGYYCDGTFPTAGNCQLQLTAGATCSASSWQPCQSGLHCISGICSVTGCY